MSKKLNLFGVIYPYDDCVNAVDVSKFLAELEKDEEFTVYINSPGGSVFEGLAIYNLLSEYTAQMTIKIIGEASSIASVIACAGGEGRTLIAESALMLIHKPWTFSMVDEDYIQKLQKELETIKISILKVYQRKTGKSEDELNDIMKEADYRDAEQCVEWGFADKIYVPSEDDAKLQNKSERIINQQMSKYIFMNLDKKKNISQPKKGTFTMTIEEALNKIGTLENKVETLTMAADKQKAEYDADVQSLTDKNMQLKLELEALQSAEAEMRAKLESREQELIVAEETEFCNKLVSEMKLMPAEKDTYIKILVNFRKNKDAMYNDATTMYEHLRAELESRAALKGLKQPPADPKAARGPGEDFVYSDELWETVEGRARIDAEIRRRMLKNESDYETELSNIKQGV